MRFLSKLFRLMKKNKATSIEEINIHNESAEKSIIKIPKQSTQDNTKEGSESKSENTLIILDFETNSQNAKDAIEVAAYKLVNDENAYKVIDTFHRYYFSKYDVNQMALSVHNLSPKIIAKLRKDEQYARYFEDDKEFVNFCTGSETLIAHNISFELRYIDNLVNFKYHFCTMKENRSIVQAQNIRGNIKNPKLTETLNYYNIQFDEIELHGALYDVSKTLDVLNCMNNINNNFNIVTHTIKNKSKINEEKKRKEVIKKNHQLEKNLIKKENGGNRDKEREKWLSNIECPNCASKNIHKKGKRKRKLYWVQRYQCMDCRTIFQEEIIEKSLIEKVSFLNGLSPTEEQQEILKSLPNHQLIKINAFAGTGKTSTLQMLTSYYPQKSFLYMAYNKGIQLEAEKKFSTNVEVRTVHSLAYKYVSKFTNLNLGKIANHTPKQIADIFDLEYKEAKDILLKFNQYCNSKFTNYNIDNETNDSSALISFNPSSFDEYINLIIEKIEANELEVSFNYILKKFHVLLENGLKITNYNTVMLDEAQDSNDVTLAILSLLDAKHKVLVGDKHQQIYGFNGSTNAMKRIEGYELALTETFRLPKDITYLSNQLLKQFKGEELKIISHKDSFNFQDIYNDNTKTIGLISRGNASLLITMKDLSNKNEKYKTVRHPKEIFLLLKDIAYFLNNSVNKISMQNIFLKQLKNEDDLIDYFIKISDLQLEMNYRIYKTLFMENIDDIEALEREAIKYYSSKDNFRNFLTTAHSSKGLEFDCVILNTDFFSFPYIICGMKYKTYQEYISDISQNTNLLVEEFNLFYVALTRSKYSINIDDEYLKYLEDGWLNNIDEALFNFSCNERMPCYSKTNKSSNSYSYSKFTQEDSTAKWKSNNAYIVLGLSSNSSETDIKIQYRKLIRMYHPDLTKDKQEEYTEIAKKINWAYNKLKS